MYKRQVLDGEIYEGRGIGGSELGHMVIVENGEPCTCGRRGCLEAYASATALKREAKRISKKELTPSEIFALAKQGDPAMKEVVETYIRRLGLGTVSYTHLDVYKRQIYYGCADTYVGLAFTTVEDVVSYIKEHSVVSETDTESGIR